MATEISKGFIASLFMAVVLVSNIFLFVPFTIYSGNKEAFITPVWEILRWYSIPALVLLMILVLIGLFLRGKIRTLYTVILAVLGLLVWLQSNAILLWDYAIFDGRTIEWSRYSWRGWLDATLWIVAIAGALLAYQKLFKHLTQIAVLIFLLQFINLGYITISHGPQLSKLHQDPASNGALQNIYQFSSTHNVLHLLIDGFQSDIFEELMTHPDLGADYRTEFSGFKFYKETLGTFAYTRFAIPAFLSTKIYHNDMVKNEFIKHVLADNTILNLAHEKGYEVDLVSTQFFAPLYAAGQHENSYVIPTNLHAKAIDFEIDNATIIMDLSLFRMVPHFLKKRVYNDQRWLINPRFIDAAFMQFPYFAHTAFVENLVKNMSVQRTTPVYKYIHLMNTHPPMVVDQKCEYPGMVLRYYIRPTLLIQSRCTLNTVIKLFRRMKELGIYDDTLIIVHADHGGWIRPIGFKSYQLEDGFVVLPKIAGAASPLLAIKPPHSQGELEISGILASLTDIPDTVSSIMKWDTEFGGEALTKIDPAELRNRKFYFYEYKRDHWISKHTGPIQEFTIRGKHLDVAWQPGEVFLPPETSTLQ